MRTRSMARREKNKLNNLPDEIRFKIVSFLDLKEAAKLTLLSKQWRSILSSLTSLTFTKSSKGILRSELRDRTFNKEYGNLINRTIISHDKSPIEKFSLTVSIDGVNITKTRVRHWIKFAVTHKVKDLHLGFTRFTSKISAAEYRRCEQNNLSPYLQEVPHCLYTCSALRVLSLGYVNLYHPVSFGFPLLKSLTLSEVQIVAGDSSIEEMSMCCDNTLLETLVINRVKYAKPLNISGAHVKCLTLKGLEERDLKIHFSMPSVIEFDFRGEKVVNISLDAMLLSVWKAGFYVKDGSMTLWAKRLMMGLCNVEMLTLSTFNTKILGDDQLLKEQMPTQYCRVKHLIFNSNIIDNQVNLLSFILKMFPNLHTLVINIESEPSNTVEKGGDRPAGVCFVGQNLVMPKEVESGDGWLLGEGTAADALKRVKKVKIYSFGGSVAELNLVRYLYHQARIVETIDIHYTPCSDDKFKMVSARLMSFSKTSKKISIKEHN